MATISKYGDPELREPASVLVKPLMRSGGADGLCAGFVEVDVGGTLFAYNAANGSPNYYLPLVDAQQLRTRGMIDF